MGQLEQNLAFRLTRLEQKLDAYRKLHAEELDEMVREIAELRREVEKLARVAAPTAEPAVDRARANGG